DVAVRIAEEEAFDRAAACRCHDLHAAGPQSFLQAVEAVARVGHCHVPAKLALERRWCEVCQFDEMHLKARRQLQPGNAERELAGPLNRSPAQRFAKELNRGRDIARRQRYVSDAHWCLPSFFSRRAVATAG